MLWFISDHYHRASVIRLSYLDISEPAFSASHGPRSLKASNALAHTGKVLGSSAILDVRKSHRRFPCTMLDCIQMRQN